MKKINIICVVFIIIGCTTFNKKGTYDLLSNTQIIFASADVAKDYLKIEDVFLLNLSPFDRSARLKTSREIGKTEFLDFISAQTRDWNKNEKEKINDIMYQISFAFSEYNLSFPDEIIFVKTIGLEEGNAAYCRGNNIIVLPIDLINLPTARLFNLIIHELFHIYSRNNLEIQEILYNMLSFKRTNELLLPDELFQKKITNPDAAVNNYYFSSKINGNNYDLMPILLASSNYDEQKGGRFFDYLELYFIAVTYNGHNMVPFIENNRYFLFTLNQIPNYFELIGRNTDYIIILRK
jgi:hypothetical protein